MGVGLACVIVGDVSDLSRASFGERGMRQE